VVVAREPGKKCTIFECEMSPFNITIPGIAKALWDPNNPNGRGDTPMNLGGFSIFNSGIEAGKAKRNTGV